MGLDMYLYKHKKLRENDNEYNELVRENGDEVMYWRKANQIRSWFVNNTDLRESDDCEWIELSKEILEKLKDDCNKVLENHKLATDLFPVSQGFFFGNQEYDEWYYETLKNTAIKIKDILEYTDFETEAISYMDWW